MKPTTPLPGQFLYAAWNVDVRTLGPFVLPSANRRRVLGHLREASARIRTLSGVGGVRLLESTFIVPVAGAPRFDITLVIDGLANAAETARRAFAESKVPEPSFMVSARNTERFGDTDALNGPIMLNHFASPAPAQDVAPVWAGISEWYGSVLGVTNSTLLTFDDPSRYVVMNYASVPGPVLRFMLDQLLRPSFRRHVLGPLRSVDARALPLFARRVR